MGFTEMKKVFIVHGWTYNLDKWQAINEVLKSKNIDPVLLKVPGLTEASDQVWDIDGYCNWLKAKLAGEEKPVVIGHSNGGRIALNLSVKEPEVIGQLILVDSAGIVNRGLVKTIKLKVLYVLAKIAKPLKKIKPLRPIVYKLIGARDYMEAPPNMRLTMENMLNADKTFDPSKVKIPTTIIWGRQDGITPLADGQKLHAAISGSSLHIIDGARHAPMATHPEQVASLIEEALK